MSKQHYQVSTYKAQLSVGYLVKRAHSLMLDIMEPLIEQRGFEAGLLSLAGLSEHRGVERVAEWFGAQSRQQRLFVELGARDELH